MKISVQPGKRNGWPKDIFAGRIGATETRITPGEISIAVTAKDIYTRGATQKFTICLSAAEIEMLYRACWLEGHGFGAEESKLMREERAETARPSEP